MSQELQQIIDAAWEDRANISPQSSSAQVRAAVEQVIHELDAGRLRVATREAVGQWTTHQWIKKAVLLSFRLRDNEVIQAGQLGFFDKVQTKLGSMSAEEMRATGTRVVLSLIHIFFPTCRSSALASHTANDATGVVAEGTVSPGTGFLSISTCALPDLATLQLSTDC